LRRTCDSPHALQDYDDLPKAITTQHRVGLGPHSWKTRGWERIQLLKRKQSSDTSRTALLAETLQARQATRFVPTGKKLRLEVLGRLLGYLGIQNVHKTSARTAAVWRSWKPIKIGVTTVQHELDQVRSSGRTRSSPQHVNDIVATDEINKPRDFVRTVGNALAEILNYELVNRKYAIGNFPMIGTVEKITRKVQ